MLIHLTFDLDNQTWEQTVDGTGPFVDVQIGFTAGGTLPVTFDNLAFGWTLHRNSEQPVTLTFPPDGTRYVTTDQPYLLCERMPADYGDNCQLEVWVTETGVESSTTVEFQIPVPEGENDGDND